MRYKHDVLRCVASTQNGQQAIGFLQYMSHVGSPHGNNICTAYRQLLWVWVYVLVRFVFVNTTTMGEKYYRGNVFKKQ